MKLSDFRCVRNQILAFNEKTEDDMKENLMILREWMKKLPHLPADELGDDFLEISYMKNKYSIEKTKKKIEEYCKIKAAKRYQYLFDRYLNPSKEINFYVSHPQVTEDFCRVHITIVKNDNEYSHLEDVRNLLMQLDLYSHYGYSNGEIVICDYSRCSALLMSKFRVNIAADCVHLALNGFSARLKQLHIVNKSAKIIFSFLIKLLPAKIASRVFFHDDYESLTRVVPAKYLPSDLGGEMESYEENLKVWDEIYEEQKDYIKKIIDIKAIEELRQGDSYKDDMNGTFKKLAID